MSKKILKLDFENNVEFSLAGIICGHKDYRLCFEINKKMGTNFVRNEDVIVDAGKPGSSTRHSYFSVQGDDSGEYHLISNRDKENTGFFIPEMRNVDYFFVVSGVGRSYNMKDLIKELKSIELIAGAYAIDPAELKSIDAFLLLLEG